MWIPPNWTASGRPSWPEFPCRVRSAVTRGPPLALGQALQLAETDAGHRALEFFHADPGAIGLDHEAVADDHRIFAAPGLVIVLLGGETAVDLADLLVAGGGLLGGFDVQRSGHAGEGAGR